MIASDVMKQVSLRLDDDLAALIDRVRGSVPRERWLREAALGVATGSHGHPPTQSTGPSPPGTTAQGRQPKVSHPKPVAASVARRSAAPGMDRNALARERVRKNNYREDGK